MAQQSALEHDAPVYNPRYADAFVIFAVTVLSLAIGVWCLQRLGMAMWSGTVMALAAYTVLLGVHLLVRRSFVSGGEDAEAEHEHGDLWTRDAHAAAGLSRLGTEDADAPRSPSEEIARWAEAARAGHGDHGAELPQPHAAGPFSYRPLQEPSLPDASAGGPLARQSPTRQPETSVELIIKKLAEQLNTTTSAARADKPAGPSETEALIGRSVAALQATARTVRGPHANFEAAPGAAPAPAAEPKLSSWWPTAEPAGSGPRAPGRPPALNPRLAPIAEAVAAERMEVLLEPIHALVEGRARHFEVSVRLLTADGTAIEPDEFVRVARGSGLMPRIDAARMVRAARVARKLGERGREGSVLAAVAGESLTDSKFIFAAAEEPEVGGGMNLVLSFAQSEVRAFTPGHAQALGALATLGFSFALEEVTDLDMDFAQLKEMGFAFVELDAPVFLDGLPAPNGRVPASDICKHLADFGLTLIVGGIEDEWLQARILGFGVLLGKGTLFGAPRLVKDEVVANPATA